VEVHGCVRLLGQTQEEVAQRYGLTQARVSQICTQVQDWREWVDARPPSQQSLDERRRVALRRFWQHYQQIYAIVTRNLAANPHDRQLLKLAERMLSKLCELCELDANHPPRGGTASAGDPAAADEFPNITYIGSDPFSLQGEIVGQVRPAANSAGQPTCGETTSGPHGDYSP
jgi:hypothetical protein